MSVTIYSAPFKIRDKNGYYVDIHAIAANGGAAALSDTLTSTEDETDRTGDISSMLVTGHCRLGPGKFYVRNLAMPNDTTIEGSGEQTTLILADDVTDGFAVRLGSRCSIRNLRILGDDIDPPEYKPMIEVTEEIGARHGILFEGTEGFTPRLCKVSDVIVAYFSGGGITCRDSSQNTNAQLSATNVACVNCGAGINIAHISEFHQFTNVTAGFCYYGCINNGGNNSFVNCNFSKNVVGFLIDNTGGKSKNNAHGQCVGCTFDHSDGNTGVGIKILRASFGFVFSGCQLFYSSIFLDRATGIIFDALNAGKNIGIDIAGGTTENNSGTTAIFNCCMFGSLPTVSISGENNHVFFHHCRTYDGTEVISQESGESVPPVVQEQTTAVCGLAVAGRAIAGTRG